jgi:hypothetical protein
MRNWRAGILKSKRLGKCAVISAGLAVVFLSQAGAVRADSLTFSAGNYSQSGLLNDGTVGTSFDILNMTGLSGTSIPITVGTPLMEAISSVTFTDGPSCYYGAGCDGVSEETGTASFGLTVDGITQTVSVPFLACLTPDGGTVVPLCTVTNATDDIITFSPSSPLVFQVSPTEEVTVTTLGLGPVVGGSGAQVLDATFVVSTAEPSSLLLLGVGLLSIMLVAKKFRLPETQKQLA